MIQVADWHGEQAAAAYLRWVQMSKDNDLRDYCRYAKVADAMWNHQRRMDRLRRNANNGLK